MKNKNLSYGTARLPSVEECEKCAFQDECEGGKYCVPSIKKEQPAIRKGETISYQAMLDHSYIDRIEELKHRLAEARKETAKEILVEIDNALHELAMFYADKGHKNYYLVCEYVHLRVISKIAQKYGVEVEK